MSVTVDELRALVRDDDENVFTDENLESAITAAGGEDNANPLRAAGIAFRSLAAEYAIRARSIKTDDLAIDTRSRGKDLNEVADSFFKDAIASEQAEALDFFDIVPTGKISGSCRAELDYTCHGNCCGGW